MNTLKKIVQTIFINLSLEDIDKSIKFLRKEKSDYTDSNLKSDALKSAPLFRKYILTLFNAMVNHGYTPDSYC